MAIWSYYSLIRLIWDSEEEAEEGEAEEKKKKKKKKNSIKTSIENGRPAGTTPFFI